MIMNARRRTPPWLFGIVGIPYGVGGVFVSAVMPFLAERADFGIEDIGWFFLALFLPTVVQFLYAPIVDVGLKRKHWFLVVATLGAACFAAAIATPIDTHTDLFLAFAFAGQFLTGLTGSCNGGLLALTIPDEKRGAAGGWLNIGNLSGGAVAAWLTLYLLANDVDHALVGVVYAAMVVLPGLPILLVDEPAIERRTARQVFGEMWSGVRTVLFNKKGLTAFALCMSPVGTAALGQFFPGMKRPFFATDGTVEIISGPGAALLTALGAGVGGWLCDNYNRRAMYLAAGVLTAACGVAMGLAPRTDTAFLVTALAYTLVTGFCYSAFTSVVLETIGGGARGASTRYALFVAAGNFAIWYVGFADTRFGGTQKFVVSDHWWWRKEEAFPVVGNVIACDVVLNLVGVVVLSVVFWKLGSFGRRRIGRSAPGEAS
jgi:MFS family permease